MSDKGVILPAALRAPKGTSQNRQVVSRVRPTRRRGSSLPHQRFCKAPAIHSKYEFIPARAVATCRSLETPSGTSRNRYLLALRRGKADGFHRPQTKPLVSQADSSAPRRSRWLPPRPNEAPGFPCRPIRDARSAEWELMSALSLTPNARGHGFQMHHYRNCAGDPLSRGF